MIAVSKKYTLKQPQIKWLLGVVYSISNDESPVTDYSKINEKSFEAMVKEYLKFKLND